VQSSVTQGTYGLFTLSDEEPIEESGNSAIDAGLYYVDQDTGIIYTREAIDGDAAADGTWSAQGKVVPFVGDQTAPAVPTGLTVTPITVQQDDGTVLPAFRVEWDANDEDDLIGYTLQYDETGTAWAYPVVESVGFDNSIVVSKNIIAGTTYDFRLAARDAEGFTSAWSSTVSGTADPDGSAPAIPTGLTAVSGFKMLGLRWDRNEERDLAFYQVRFYITSEGVAESTYMRTLSSRIIIEGLTPDVEYTAQVRAVDRSGNVRVSGSPDTPLDPEVIALYEEDDTVGWSDAATGTPSLIAAEDVVFRSVLAGIVDANAIDADTITAGDLAIGGSGMAGSIEVYSSGGVLIAEMGNRGLLLFNPNDSLQAMWLTAGSIWFSSAWDGSVDTTEWTAGMTPEGVNASAITFGIASGGANSVPNSGFELSAFVVLTEQVWDNTPWGTPASTVNLNTAGATLTMTAS
jgi:hypothetical protein